eukprot:GHRQ01032949.1.p1 GENE.GHRQ01032949.1~~GHRQ01032949.1.p1  ORF type:complete len:122 (-),score=13.25 GHRQ01032949.1:156-521(-)
MLTANFSFFVIVTATISSRPLPAHDTTSPALTSTLALAAGRQLMRTSPPLIKSPILPRDMRNPAGCMGAPYTNNHSVNSVSPVHRLRMRIQSSSQAAASSVRSIMALLVLPAASWLSADVS